LATTKAPATLCSCREQSAWNEPTAFLSAASVASEIVPFFFQTVGFEDTVDLLRGQRESASPQTRRDGVGVVFGRVDDGEKNIDDTSRIERGCRCGRQRS
jgi:hypothetical protein